MKFLIFHWTPLALSVFSQDPFLFRYISLFSHYIPISFLIQGEKNSLRCPPVTSFIEITRAEQCKANDKNQDDYQNQIQVHAGGITSKTDSGSMQDHPNTRQIENVEQLLFDWSNIPYSIPPFKKCRVCFTKEDGKKREP